MVNGTSLLSAGPAGTIARYRLLSSSLGTNVWGFRIKLNGIPGSKSFQISRNTYGFQGGLLYENATNITGTNNDNFIANIFSDTVNSGDVITFKSTKEVNPAISGPFEVIVFSYS
jgi:hypothetical protein